MTKRVGAGSMGRRAVLLGVCALVAASCWKPSLTPDYTWTKIDDIVYAQGEVDGGSGGGVFEDLVLDLYVPDVPGQTVFPLMVALHGGSFRTGDEERARIVSWAQAFASHGYLVASIDYRLEGDEPVPSARVQALYDAVGGAAASWQTIAAIAAIDDTLAALDYLHTRPDVEPWQTVLNGGSAGAIIALYVGYALDDYGIERPSVAAVLDNFGGFGWANTPGDATLLDGAASRVVRHDPLYIYSEPPLYLLHGTADTVVPYQHTQDIVDRADAIGHRYRLASIPGAGHSPDVFTTEVSPGVTVFQDQINWLDSVLIGVEETTTTTTTSTIPTTVP